MSKAEKFIQEHTKRCSNVIRLETPMGLGVETHPWLTPDQALRAVEIAREEEWKYIEYQLQLRLPETLDYNGIKVDRKDVIQDIKQAMKNET